MADRPILFSAPMIRALRDGRKTQTRRIIKPQPAPADGWDWTWPVPGKNVTPGTRQCWRDDTAPSIGRYMPYVVGDRLWVREAAWICPPRWTDTPANPMGPDRQEVAYRADDRSGYTAEAAADYKLKLRPSIHMPRWASRLTLVVTDVRVQRLQDISELDISAEGVRADLPEPVAPGRPSMAPITWSDGVNLTATAAFKRLWNSINGDGAWDANPWVAAYTFTVHARNIDRMDGEG